MKATVLQDELNKGLAAVGKVVATRGQLPVLANVLVEARGEGVRLSATNLELGMRTEVGGKVEEAGAITVPARSLAEFVASVSGEQVGLTTEGEKLKVEAGKFGGVFAGIGASEFPVMPELVKGKAKAEVFRIKKEVVEEIGREVAYAAAVDESRPVLTGIRFGVDNGQVVVTATDGFRLSRKVIVQDSGFRIGDSVILPAKTILELTRVVGEGRKEEVEVMMVGENNQVVFGYDKTQLISRVLEGNFPEVEKIIPTEHKTEVKLEREELERAVRAASIFARESNNIIRFRIGDSGFRIYAAAGQSGEGEMEVEAEKKGEDVEVAFNYRYVLDFLGSGEGEMVVLSVNGPMAPGVWRPEGDESLIHLIMPVRV